MFKLYLQTIFLSMESFIAWSATQLTNILQQAALQNHPESIRKLNHDIEAMNNIFTSAIQLAGGSMISTAGPDGRAQLPADKLDILPDLRSQAESAINSPLGLGVGMKVSEAERAVRVTSKNRPIVFYSPQVDKELEERKEDLQKSLGMNPGGFSGKHPGQQAAKPIAPKPEASEHSEGEGLLELINDEDRPPAPEGTHAAQDFEDNFHQLAQQQAVKDDSDRQQNAKNLQGVKAQVIQALQAVRAQTPKLVQMQQAAPEVYQAVMGVVSAVIALGREVAPGVEEVKKDEEQDPDFEPLHKAEAGVRYLVHFGKIPNLNEIDTKHMGSGAPTAEYSQGIPKTPRAYFYLENSSPERLVVGLSSARYAAALPSHHKIYDLAVDEAGLVGKARKTFRGVATTLSDHIAHIIKKAGYCGYSNSQSSIPHVVAVFHSLPAVQIPYGRDAVIPPSAKRKIPLPVVHKAELEPSSLQKAKLPMPSPKGIATPRIVLPVGSIVGHKVKVAHADGSASWNQEGAGRVLGQDPAGHSVSARNPGAK